MTVSNYAPLSCGILKGEQHGLAAPGVGGSAFVACQDGQEVGYAVSAALTTASPAAC